MGKSDHPLRPHFDAAMKAFEEAARTGPLANLDDRLFDIFVLGAAAGVALAERVEREAVDGLIDSWNYEVTPEEGS